MNMLTNRFSYNIIKPYENFKVGRFDNLCSDDSKFQLFESEYELAIRYNDRLNFLKNLIERGYIIKSTDLYGFETFYKYGKLNNLNCIDNSKLEIKKKLKYVAKHRLFTKKDYSDWCGGNKEEIKKFSKIKLGYCYLDHTGLNYIIYNFKNDKFFYFDYKNDLYTILNGNDPNNNGCFGNASKQYLDNLECMIQFIIDDFDSHYTETSKTVITNISPIYIRKEGEEYLQTNRKIDNINIYISKFNQEEIYRLDNIFTLIRKLYHDIMWEHGKLFKNDNDKELIQELNNIKFHDSPFKILYNYKFISDHELDNLGHGDYINIFHFIFKQKKVLILYIKNISDNTFEVYLQLLLSDNKRIFNNIEINII